MTTARRVLCACALLGAGSISAGCSDPVPPPAQGAASIHVGQRTGQNCPTLAHLANAPDPPRGQSQNVSATEVKNKAVDREGAQVRCKVKPAGGSFQVEASISVGNVSFSVDTTVADGQSNAQGSATEQDAETEVTLTSQDVPCTIGVKGNELGVAAGRIWGKIECTKVVDARSPGNECAIDYGFFLFENCSQ